MSISFREISHNLDRMYPPLSLMTLARRFRYKSIAPGELPNNHTISLRELGIRISGSSSRRAEFLHYNTFLLRDYFKFEDVVKAAGGVGQFAACMGLSVADILAKVLRSIGSSDICNRFFPPIVEVCGISPNPLNDACKLIGSVGELAAFLVDEVGIVVDEVFDIFGIGFNAAVDILFEILFPVLGIISPFDITTNEKPDIDKRVTEIGDQVFSYDIVSLCEVWRPEFKSALLSRGSVVATFTGPGDPAIGEWEHLGSGLLVFSPSFPVFNGGVHTYQKAGVSRNMPGGCDFGRIVDSDLWARKGVQMTLINLGVGIVEIYSTHLYSGGDMPDWLSSVFGGAPSDAEKASVRRTQIDELAKFISKTHNKQNVAIIVGDFNVGPSERGYLLTRLRQASPGIEFDDWYSLTTFTSIYPQGGTVDPGHTNRGESVTTFDTVCKVFPQNIAAPASLPNDYYCNEAVLSTSPATGERIDYIFVQRATSDHTFNLDVSRIRRRAFKREGYYGQSQDDKHSPQWFMSDHLGLEITLFAST